VEGAYCSDVISYGDLLRHYSDFIGNYSFECDAFVQVIPEDEIFMITKIVNQNNKTCIELLGSRTSGWVRGTGLNGKIEYAKK